MTNKDEAIANIKESLKKLMSFGSKEMKCEDMNLKDGSVISIEEGSNLEVGTPVYKKDADGTLVPCEDGSYELQDGRSISCKGGKVESVAGDAKPQEASAGSPDAEAKMEAAAAPEAEAPEVEVEKPEGSDLESRIKALEEHIAQILSVLADMTKMTEKAMSKVEEFAAKPAEEPIKEKKKEADVYTKTRATQKAFSAELDELRSIINKSNNSYGSFTVGQ